jgi:hypothetical protein
MKPGLMAGNPSVILIPPNKCRKLKSLFKQSAVENTSEINIVSLPLLPPIATGSYRKAVGMRGGFNGLKMFAGN